MFTKIAKFLRLLNEDKTLSLTNVSMYVTLYKLATITSPTYTEVGTFFLAVAAYNYNKHIGAKYGRRESTVKTGD